jgi:ATP-binding cassette subfamily C protein
VFYYPHITSFERKARPADIKAFFPEHPPEIKALKDFDPHEKEEYPHYGKPENPRQSDKGAESQGGGGGTGQSRLQKRAGSPDFREVLTKGLAQARRNLVIVALFSLVINLLVLAIPLYLFQISDRVLTSRSTDTLVMLTIIVVGAIVMNVLLDIVRRFILMRTAVDVEARLGAPVLSAAAKAAQHGSSREFQTLSDLQQVRGFITGPTLLTMFDAPVAPIYFLVVFLIHPHLGLIATSTGVLLFVIALINQRVTAQPFSRANMFAGRANLQADAMARNAQVMNAMGMIPEGVISWGRETAQSLKEQVIAQDRNILLAGLSRFIRLGTQIGILGWGAWLALHTEVTAGMTIAASIVAGRALAPIEGTIEGWRSFIQARSAYDRVKALLRSSPLNIDRLRLPRPSGVLNVERVLYVPPPDKRVILNGITFQLEPGESLAIVGSSGAGKSTLARMLVGSIVPTAGNIRLDRMDLRNWDPRQFGENVGYLPQDVQLFPASIKANIARMRDDASDSDVFEAAEMANVHHMISGFAQGYETLIQVDGSPLSGGQKQRIGLARAFFGMPRLVVLDEPNSNLDTAGEQALAQALARAKMKDMTVVAITQRPSLLKSVDKIALIREGSLQAIGPRAEMLPLLQKNGHAGKTEKNQIQNSNQDTKDI